MRLIVMLAALLIVGLLIYKQLGQSSVQNTNEMQKIESPDVPKIPTNQNEVKKFKSQMNAYMEQEAEKREAAIDRAVSQ